MSELPDRNELLDDIEVRQDDLLRKLDDLNSNIEKALKAQTAALAGRTDQDSSPEVETAAEAAQSPKPLVAGPVEVPVPPITTSVAPVGEKSVAPIGVVATVQVA